MNCTGSNFRTYNYGKELRCPNTYRRVNMVCCYMMLHFKLYRNIKRICYNDILFDDDYGISDCIIDNQSVLLPNGL